MSGGGPPRRPQALLIVLCDSERPQRRSYALP